MRILGIDPGLQLTGYACIDTSPGAMVTALRGHVASMARPALLEAGVFRLRAVDDLSQRLLELERDLAELIDRTKPQLACVESLFAHYAYPATAVTMGHARGVILLTIRRANVELIEFKPNAIKKHLTGNGHATKTQMQSAVQIFLGLPAPPDPADVADAIAIALCAAARTPLLQSGRGRIMAQP